MLGAGGQIELGRAYPTAQAKLSKLMKNNPYHPRSPVICLHSASSGSLQTRSQTSSLLILPLFDYLAAKRQIKSMSSFPNQAKAQKQKNRKAASRQPKKLHRCERQRKSMNKIRVTIVCKANCIPRALVFLDPSQVRKVREGVLEPGAQTPVVQVAQVVFKGLAEEPLLLLWGRRRSVGV
jgi:hypothetical protein